MSGRDASVVGYRLRHLTLLGASLISIIGTTAVSASLPAMSSYFAATTGDLFWVRLTLTLPALTTALFGPVAGAVIDRCGRRTVLVASLLAYASAGMYGALAGSLTSLMISRLLFGAAIAGVMTSATALLSDSAHDTSLDRYMGRQSMFMGLGSVVFLPLGGLLAQVDWRYPFLLYAVALLLLPGVVLLVQEPARWSNSEGDLWQPRHIAARPGPPSGVCLLAFVNMALYFLVPVGLPFLLLSFPGHSESRTGRHARCRGHGMDCLLCGLPSSAAAVYLRAGTGVVLRGNGCGTPRAVISYEPQDRLRGTGPHRSWPGGGGTKLQRLDADVSAASVGRRRHWSACFLGGARAVLLACRQSIAHRRPRFRTDICGRRVRPAGSRFRWRGTPVQGRPCPIALEK